MTNKNETEWTGGYGEPPYEHRFRKGQSGNPSGGKRGPKPVRAVGDIALKALREPVPIKVGKKTVKMPAMDAIISRGRRLALTSEKLLDVTRFIDSCAKIGFNYLHEESAARVEERRQYEEALALSRRSLAMCHAEIEKLRRMVAKHPDPSNDDQPTV